MPTAIPEASASITIRVLETDLLSCEAVFIDLCIHKQVVFQCGDFALVCSMGEQLVVLYRITTALDEQNLAHLILQIYTMDMNSIALRFRGIKFAVQASQQR